MKRFVSWLSGSLLIAILFLFSQGCSDKEKPLAVLPQVQTSDITAVGDKYAVGGGILLNSGGGTVTTCGICWDTAAEPVLTGHYSSHAAQPATFTDSITGLDTSTVYHVRAYAVNEAGTAYGNTVTFKTSGLPDYGTVSDVDGNKYRVIRIGSMYWLRSNLSVTKYRNGDAIPVVTADNQWKTLTTGAICSFENSGENTTRYGLLYNKYAVDNAKGICPAGWHVPSREEWTQLAQLLGGPSKAGGHLKSRGTIEAGTGLWYAPNAGATDSVGFSCLPGGYRINYGTFYSLGNVAFFWTSSDSTAVYGWNMILDANNPELQSYFNPKAAGFSVRCAKDQ